MLRYGAKNLTNHLKSHLKRYVSSQAKIALPGQLINVGKYKIHYEIIGRGPEYILFLPASMGTGRTDFLPQLEYFDQKRFTLIGMSPPGNGMSAPYETPPNLELVHKDAEVAANFLTELGLKDVNVVGWCSGGITAAILAGLNPHLVKKLVLIAPWMKITQADVDIWNAMKDISTWDPVLLDALVEIYGFDTVQEKWDMWRNFGQGVVNKKNGEAAVKECRMIKCPTIVIHSNDDNFITYEPHASLTTSLIKNARLVSIPNGRHAVHLRLTEKVNKVINDFILD